MPRRQGAWGACALVVDLFRVRAHRVSSFPLHDWGASRPDCACASRLTRFWLCEIEQQEFCRLDGMYLEHGLFSHSSPVPGRQRRVMKPHRPANDLHPGMAIVAQVMMENARLGAQPS